MSTSFDFERYKQKKQKGLAEIKTVDENVAVVEKRYDPETGAEVNPHITYINTKELEVRKVQLETELQQIHEILDELPIADLKDSKLTK